MKENRKHSKKRDEILRVLHSTKSHPSAQWIYEQLKPTIPDLSMGTVYRNLSLFRREGDIACVGTVNGEERFDGNTQLHSHFICDNCGAVIDIAHEEDTLDDKDISKKTKHQIDYHNIIFHGKCKTCISHINQQD